VSQNAGLSVINCKREIIEKIFSERGLDLAQIQNGIDNEKKPNSFELENIMTEIETNVEPVKAVTDNVIGLLEGNDPVLKMKL
jgi:hypothetical protein